MSLPAPAKKVIIIGGGIAGIKAAIDLQKKSVDYLIFEAKGRLGGRLNTVTGFHGKYDLGASWFHETLNNPLFDEEMSLGNPIDDPKIFYDDGPKKIFNKDGIVSPFLKLDSIVNELFKYVDICNEEDLDSDKPYYENVINYLRSRKHLLTDEQITNVSQYARSLELWHGIDSQMLSSKYASIDNEGRDALCLNYDRVLKRHTDQLDQEKVFLNTPVTGVSRIEKGSKVEIELKDGKKLVADAVIVAVPQSILQLSAGEDGYIEFSPKLPAKITDSLQSIHFGALGKVILEFEDIFWPTDFERASILSDPPEGFLRAIKDNKDVPEFTRNKSSHGHPQTWDFPAFVLNYAGCFQKPSLVILTQQPLTNYLESNKDIAWKHCKPMIQVLSGKTDVPDPINVIVTNWTQDVYQRGAYSACYPGDDPLMPILALEEGFGNVRFAGEHTVLEGAGCVHGAWSSGKREAEALIERFGL
ncbi:hypothetical protein WICPIJ_004412 [Wickerhamomyces pijperi]|uniref:Amine oxidase n=1 Tax=Wickerhamomyces pijperi TaxID=599730 RepID=A0A9P8Q5K8_WICPI|nr:hypothetical protein WICPIJ_004412 [Wickerhamomyces pijperi]